MFIWCQWSNMVFLVLLNHKQTKLPITLQLSQIESLFSVVLMAARLSSRESSLRTLNGIAGGENRRLSALCMLERWGSLRCLFLSSSSFVECYRLAHLFMARNNRQGKEIEGLSLFPQNVLEKEEFECTWDSVSNVIFSVTKYLSGNV